jgi:signal transduction histidine kinase
VTRRVLLVAGAGLLLGLAAQWSANFFVDPRRWIPDLAVGWTFIACGLIADRRRPSSRTGVLLAVTGFTWFAGNFTSVDVEPIAWLSQAAQYLHRGPLIHAVLSFPTGRLVSAPDRAVVAIGYVVAAVAPIAQDRLATVALATLVPAAAAWGYRRSAGPGRRARAWVVRAAVWVGVLLAGAALARLAVPASAVGEAAVVLGYQIGLCAVAIGLVIAVVRADWERAGVTDLVVELTEGPTPTLRDTLARELGDPTIEIGYRLPGAAGYVDARGRPVAVPEAGTNRAVTPIELNGQRVAVLVHDPAVLEDPGLLGSVSAAAALAATNARLQAEVRAQIAEVEESRRRLLDAGDEERRRLQERLRAGAERRLRTVGATLARARVLAERSGDRDLPERSERAERQVTRTLEDLEQLARGLHPPALEDAGLAEALRDLVGQSPVPISLNVSADELPRETAAAAYFVCSEALANIAKYAGASHGVVSVASADDRLMITVTDDGIGGADRRKGSGLEGLADRIDTLGGTFTVESPHGAGTRLTAQIPLGAETR